MNLTELKDAARSAVGGYEGCGDPECRCFRCIVTPENVLALIEVVECASTVSEYGIVEPTGFSADLDKALESIDHGL